jgi:hypothetical protein
VVTREEYRRLEGFVGTWDVVGRPDDDETLLRYVLVNLTLLGAGMAAWTGVIAGLMWLLY